MVCEELREDNGAIPLCAGGFLSSLGCCLHTCGEDVAGKGDKPLLHPSRGSVRKEELYSWVKDLPQVKG